MLEKRSISQIKRYFGYAFWVALETAIFVGLSRAVLFPVVAYLLGKEEFGLFLFAFSIVMIIGSAPAEGLMTGILRCIAGYEGLSTDRLISTAIWLCKIAMLIIVTTGLIVLGIVSYFYQVQPKVIWCILALLILLYSWNIFELQMVRYRAERKFALRTAWYSLLSMLTFIAIPAAIFGGVVGMTCGYALGYVITQILVSWKQKILFKKIIYDAETGYFLKKVWLFVSISSILSLSSRSIYRIILGIFYSYSTVSILFGATNIIDLCTAPLSMLSSLLLSMLSGFERLGDVGRKKIYLVFGVAVSISFIAPIIVFFAGPLISSIMFPGFAAESTQLLRRLIIIIPFVTIRVFANPFIVKFGPIKFIPILSFTALAAHLLPAIFLIPKFGLNGAVISYYVGHGATTLAWLLALIWTFKFGGDRILSVTPEAVE